MNIVSFASVVVLWAVATSAQTTEGPRIFSGSNSSQVVSVKQNSSGLGLKATSPSKSAIFAQSPGINGATIVGKASASFGIGIGVRGVTTSADGGVGVWGEATCLVSGCTNVDGSSVGVVGVSANQEGGIGVAGQAPTRGMVGVASGAPGFQATGVSGFAAGANAVGVSGSVSDATAVAGNFDNEAGGNILVGSTRNQRRFRVDGTGKVFANGGFQSSGADFAESFAIRGDRRQYEPGDLLIIDPSGDRRLALASQPYSTFVAGIYSTKPGILASPHDIQSTALSQEIPLAIVGVVPCKVTTENGPIQPGDLLVASSTPGHAMRGTERSRLTGAVVGKALQTHKAGRGVIQALVSLH